MKSNEIPEALDALEISASNAESGALALGAAIGLKQNTVVEIRSDKEDVYGKPQDPQNPDPNAPIGKRAEHAQARSAAALTRAGSRAATALGRDFCSRATDALRLTLGRRWNAKWHAAGFTSGSLALAKDPLGITAAEADANIRAIEAARMLETAAAAAETTAKSTRDTSVRRLRRRLTALRNELSLLLEADDARWYQFGFSRPIDSRLPEMVDTMTVEPGTPGMLIVRWQPAVLADTYRITRQVAGVDTEPVNVGIFADAEVLVTGLPSGATVTIRVSARNIAGETLPTAVQAIVP